MLKNAILMPMTSTPKHPATLTLHVRGAEPDGGAWLEIRFRATDGADTGITYGLWDPQGVAAGREYAIGLKRGQFERTVQVDETQIQKLLEEVRTFNDTHPGHGREHREAKWTRHPDNVLWARQTWERVTGERLDQYYNLTEKTLHHRAAASLARAIEGANERHPSHIEKRPITDVLFDDNRRYRLPSVVTEMEATNVIEPRRLEQER